MDGKTKIKKLKNHLLYIIHNGKNSKWKYFCLSYFSLYIPRFVSIRLRKKALKSLANRADKGYILSRVEYYNQLNANVQFDKVAFEKQLVELKQQKIGHPSVYYLDSFVYAKRFPLNYKWHLLPGDITHVPSVPAITKTRPLGVDNTNSVLLKLDKVRHFIFVKDRKPFRKKKNKAIFRGLIGQVGGGNVKRNRLTFVEKFFGHPLFDIGVIDKGYQQWQTDKLTIRQHLNYKFVISLEGNDVASNLKWIMSSNSVAVMPRPTCESWFMEGKLIPNYHYIEIKADFSDVEERLNHYIAHPEEAEAIIQHAHEYVDQFRDSKRERLITYLVLQKYFLFTEQQLSTLRPEN